jgi:hypothetical protein
MHLATPALELVLGPERELDRGRGCDALRLWWHDGIFLLDTAHRKT